MKNHLARCQNFIQSSNVCSGGKLCSNRVVGKLWDTIKQYIYIYIYIYIAIYIYIVYI